MKVLLCCASGMSTSLLMTNVRKAAEKRQIDLEIEAVSLDKVAQSLEGVQVVLLGPQVRFKEKEITKLCEPLSIACGVIDPISYGRIDGEKVLELATSLT